MAFHWRAAMALAMVVLEACSSEVAFVDDASSDDASSDDASSSSVGELEAPPTSSCAPEATIPGLPFALARRDDAGELHVHVQSFPSTCHGFEEGWATDQARIWLHVAADAGAGTLDLRDVDAVAYMAAGAPGNAGSVAELAWLDGELVLDASDDTIVGTIDDRTVPFSGCFIARVCP
jgi:hypothetical protein